MESQLFKQGGDDRKSKHGVMEGLKPRYSLIPAIYDLLREILKNKRPTGT